MQIHNTRHLILSSSDYRISKIRLNGLFLSKVFDDGEMMRELIHHRSPRAEPIISALIKYNDDKNIEQFYQSLDAVTSNNNLEDGKSEEYQKFNSSKWFDTKIYNQTYTFKIEDRSFPESPSKQYTKVKPIDVLKETLELEQNILREKPQTQNSALDLTLANIFNNHEINEQVLTKSLRLFNKDLINAFSEYGELTFGHFDALNLLTDKSANLLEGIDYQRQRTFYNSDLCTEIVKFSYLTTFTKNKNFDNSDLEKHLFEIKKAGNWIIGGHLIADKITANSQNIIGLNNNLITLASIKPLHNPKSLPILKRYRDEDTHRIAQNYLNFETKIFHKGYSARG